MNERILSELQTLIEQEMDSHRALQALWQSYIYNRLVPCFRIPLGLWQETVWRGHRSNRRMG